MDNRVKDFCKEFGFCDEAEDFLSHSYKLLSENKAAYNKFSDCISVYEKDHKFDHIPIFECMKEISQMTGIHKYTLDLLYMISLVPHLKELYAAAGIDRRILYDSVCDLKWKAAECKAVYDVWGTSSALWTISFFKLDRFALGRLQFNLAQYPRDYEFNGVICRKGDIYIAVHIPSSGPLKREECIASYKRAAEFYKDRFADKPIIFGCASWLMSPNNYEILPPNSNIIPFMKDYTVLATKKDEKNANLWRIFGRVSLPSDVDSLPQDSSLRRAFVKWLKEGNTIDEAFGVFVYNI